MTIVLVTKGKHESVDYAKVFLFPDDECAIGFCVNMRTGKTKHWTDAQIVKEGEEIELMQPQDDDA